MHLVQISMLSNVILCWVFDAKLGLSHFSKFCSQNPLGFFASCQTLPYLQKVLMSGSTIISFEFVKRKRVKVQIGSIREMPKEVQRWVLFGEYDCYS